MSNNNWLMSLELISESGLVGFRWNLVFFLGVQQEKYVTLVKYRLKGRLQKSACGWRWHRAPALEQEKRLFIRKNA
jgi:hypothetical protein